MTAYVNPGRINKRVRVQKYNPGATRNEAGGLMSGVDGTYQDIGEHWFGIEALSVSERLRDGRTQGEETHRLVARADRTTARLRARDRLVYVDRWNVTHVYDLVGTFDVAEEGRMTQTRAMYRPQPDPEP